MDLAVHTTAPRATNGARASSARRVGREPSLRLAVQVGQQAVAHPSRCRGSGGRSGRLRTPEPVTSDHDHRTVGELREQRREVRDDLPAEQLADLVLALTDGFSARLLHTPLRSPQHAQLLVSLDLALHELLVPS